MFKDKVKRLCPEWLLGFLDAMPAKVGSYSFHSSRPDDIINVLRGQHNLSLSLLDSYSLSSRIHKWHHYLPLYEKYFEKFRGRPLRFLEIGLGEGGSLSLWRNYFGPDATIFGIDINPSCKDFDGVDGVVRIGSQADDAFLKSVLEEMGGVDIVLDDGSHQMLDIKASLRILFPMLADGGLYLIEDLHTSYWRGWQGGYYSKNNFFNIAKEIIHDMHHWYHSKPIKHPLIAPSCKGIHIHDSIAVLEKGSVMPPKHSILER